MASTPALGEDPVANKPVVIARVAIGSQGDIQTLANQLDVPLPAILTPGGVEQMFGFLGPGGFNPNLPVAVDFLAGTGLAQAQQAMFYLPVTDGHAPISDFLKHGDKLGEDGAIVNNSPFRRTGDYLLFGGTPEAIMALKTEEMVGQMSDHPLLYIDFDAATLRAAQPELVAKFKQNLIDNHAAPRSQAEDAGYKLGVNMCVNGFDKLTFRLEKKADSVRAVTLIDPFPALPEKTWKLQGMPGDVAVRLDIQLPPHFIKPALNWLRATIHDADFFKGISNPTPARKDQFIDALADSFETIAGGDVGSYGLGISDGSLVVYLVTQSATSRDSQKDWKRIVDEMNAFDTDSRHQNEVQLAENINANGDADSRITFLNDDGKPEGFIESVDRQQTRFTTITKLPNRAIEALLACKPAGTLQEGASGYVDLERSQAFLALLPPAVSTQLNETDRNLLMKVLLVSRLRSTSPPRKDGSKRPSISPFH